MTAAETEGIPGPPGEKGDKGDKGEKGATGSIAVTMIDVLFALVLSQVFLATNGTYQYIPAAGWGLLILATVLISLSWVGYHINREQTRKWKLEFYNREFVQYVVDVAILGAYWAVVITNQGVPDVVHTASGFTKVHYESATLGPAANLIAIVFLLYLIWDFFSVGHEIENGDATSQASARKSRCVTAKFLALFVVNAALIQFFPPGGDFGIFWLSLVLCVPLIVYRLCLQKA